MLNIRDICNTKAYVPAPSPASTGVVRRVRADVSRSKFWKRTVEEGRPGWKRIVVALIADGLGPMDTNVLDVLATIGVYQDGVLKKAVDDKQTVAHIFEVSDHVHRLSMRSSAYPSSTPRNCRLMRGPSLSSLTRAIRIIWYCSTQTGDWGVRLIVSGPGTNHLCAETGEYEKDQLAPLAV